MWRWQGKTRRAIGFALDFSLLLSLHQGKESKIACNNALRQKHKE
jgi:hypothetical protein